MTPAPHYEWRGRRDLDCDALGIIVCALLDDHDAGGQLLQTLDRRQAVALCWVIAQWHARSLAHVVEDPLATLQSAALKLNEEEQ